MIEGKVEREDGIPKKLIVNSAKPLKEVRRDAISAIHIKLDADGVDDSVLSSIRQAFRQHRGECPVYFHINEKDSTEKVVKAHNTFNIHPSEELVKDLCSIVGRDCVRYTIGHQ
jgi:hypothetical protein